MRNGIASLHSFVESMRCSDVLDNDVLALISPLGVYGDPVVGFGLRAYRSLDVPSCSEECESNICADKPMIKEDVMFFSKRKSEGGSPGRSPSDASDQNGSFGGCHVGLKWYSEEAGKRVD